MMTNLGKHADTKAATRSQMASVFCAPTRSKNPEDEAPDVMSVVQTQYEGVKRNHMQVRTLRDTARAAT